ncbi:MAG TPA: hypothetical protein DCF49_06870 [Lachnospiraceae bacterium]|nr:hypothetical protein [Lachnospiraceae bacterium]
MQLPDQMSVPESGEPGIRLLKNPLPGPPTRAHVRMEFDVETPEDDDFDIEIPEGDDFDI